MIRKTCPNCKRNLPLNNFGLCKRDGFQSYCKECKTTKAKEYYKRDSKKVLQRSDKYRQTIRGVLVSRYADIKRRCTNSKHKAYKDYGGRGIKCLFESSDEFANYIMGKLQINPHGFDIDRINNNGNYKSGNIRLITHKENCNNRRTK